MSESIFVPETEPQVDRKETTLSPRMKRFLAGAGMVMGMEVTGCQPTPKEEYDTRLEQFEHAPPGATEWFPIMRTSTGGIIELGMAKLPDHTYSTRTFLPEVGIGKPIWGKLSVVAHFKRENLPLQLVLQRLSGAEDNQQLLDTLAVYSDTLTLTLDPGNSEPRVSMTFGELKKDIPQTQMDNVIDRMAAEGRQRLQHMSAEQDPNKVEREESPSPSQSQPDTSPFDRKSIL